MHRSFNKMYGHVSHRSEAFFRRPLQNNTGSFYSKSKGPWTKAIKLKFFQSPSCRRELEEMRPHSPWPDFDMEKIYYACKSASLLRFLWMAVRRLGSARSRLFEWAKWQLNDMLFLWFMFCSCSVVFSSMIYDLCWKMFQNFVIFIVSRSTRGV